MNSSDLIPTPNLTPGPSPKENHFWRGGKLPTGTVTFLFTDIQGSTPLWEREPEKMAAALQVHNTALRQAIEANGGMVFKIVGDAFHAVFAAAPKALQAAIEGQRALQSAAWNELGPLQVRMGLHTGEAELDPSGDEYAVSHTKNRVARIMSAAHGGQILLSVTVVNLLQGRLPENVCLEDLGEHHLKGLLHPEHIFQVVAPGLPADFPPPRSETRPRHNLPIQLTSFIGREKEIADVYRLLCEHRLVTLTGSGGTGKTRLSLRTAEEALLTTSSDTGFPDGVWFVELAPLTNPNLLAQTIASAWGLQESSERLIADVMVDYLKNRGLLLVVDNCEHLIEPCARLADFLLRSCPRLKILASSREALGVSGEAAYRVPSLSIPDPHDLPTIEELSNLEAVRLFTDRAAAIRPGFAITQANAQAVAQVCQRLDGIPLALELAAARVGVLSVEQIAARLNDRFRLLTGGARTALPRQQTLRASIDWSYSQLSERERTLLQRLSAFSGGWTLAAAEEVCGFAPIDTYEILDGLTSLVNKSLIGMVEVLSGHEPRYRMLETIRQYAREKLADSQGADVGGGDDIRKHHLDYFLHLAEQANPALRGGKHQLEWFDRVETELDNLRSAMEWALEAEPENQKNGLRLVIHLGVFWFNMNPKEGLLWLERGMSSVNGQDPRDLALHAWGRQLSGALYFYADNFAKAIQSLEESIGQFETLGDRPRLAEALCWLAFVLWFEHTDIERAKSTSKAAVSLARQTGDYYVIGFTLCFHGLTLQESDRDAARSSLEESIKFCEKAGDRMILAVSLRMLGNLASVRGDYPKAHSYLEKSAAIDREYKLKMQLGWDLSALGDLNFMEGRYAESEAYFQECWPVFQETGFRSGTVWALHHLGVVIRRQGQVEEARKLFLESLKLAQEYQFTDLILENVVGLAGLALDLGQAAQAARLLGAVETLPGGQSLGPISSTEFDRDRAALRAQLGEAAFQVAWRTGQGMTLEQAVAVAVEEQ